MHIHKLSCALPAILILILSGPAQLLGQVTSAPISIRITSIIPTTLDPELRPEIFYGGAPAQTQAVSFRNIIVTSGAATNPTVLMVLGLPNQREGAGHATVENWQGIFRDAPTVAPLGFHGVGSGTDFAGEGDTTTYDFSTVRVDPSSELHTNVNAYAIRTSDNTQIEYLTIVPIDDPPLIVVKTGDTILRPTTPPFTGTTLTDLGDYPIINDINVATVGFGNGFSGIYISKIEPAGATNPLTPLVENFSNADNEFQGISYIQFDQQGRILFTSGKGLYRVNPDPPGVPELLIASGTEFAPGKFFNNPSWFEVSGDRVAIQASYPSFQPAVFEGNLTTRTLDLVAGNGTDIPGETAKFDSAQRPLISGDSIIFEGFKNFDYSGVYAYSKGSLSPVLKRGDILDGKTVRLAPYEQGSFFENNLGLAVLFDDNSSWAYLARIEKKQTSPAQFIASSLKFSLNLGFTASFTGEPGRTYSIESTESLPPTWTPVTQITVPPSGTAAFTNPLTADLRRLFRIRSDFH